MPLIRPLKHHLPRLYFQSLRVIPRLGFIAQAQTQASEEVVARASVKVPHGQFQDAIPQLVGGVVFITERVVPYGVQVLFHDRSFVFGLFARVWQEVTVGNVEVKRKNNNSSTHHNQ